MWTQEGLAKLSYQRIQKIAKVCFSCLLHRRTDASPAGFQCFGKQKAGHDSSRYPGVHLPLYPFHDSVLVAHSMTLYHSCSRQQKSFAQLLKRKKVGHWLVDPHHIHDSSHCVVTASGHTVCLGAIKLKGQSGHARKYGICDYPVSLNGWEATCCA